MIIKITPTYKHLTQKKNFCGPTCLQMVLFRRNNWLSQELIAYKIGVSIQKNDKELYVLPLKALNKSDPKIGLVFKDFLDKKVKSLLNEFNLEINGYPISKIKDIRKFIISNLENNFDQMINFSWGPFDGRKNDGHYVLITDFNTKTDEITVCDPSGNKKSFWKAKLSIFVDAMLPKWDKKERGILVIKEK